METAHGIVLFTIASFQFNDTMSHSRRQVAVDFTPDRVLNTMLPDSLCPHHRHGLEIQLPSGTWDSPRTTDSIDFVLVPLSSGRENQTTLSRLSSAELPWVGWNLEDDPALAISAYQAGAHAVFPANMPVDRLRELIARGPGNNTGKCCSRSRAGVRPHERTLRKGDRLILPRESTIEIVSGVLAQYVHQQNGDQVLLGLSGYGQLLLAHPQDDCGIEIVAHTPAQVTVESWHNLQPTRALMSKLAARIQQVEAWSAVQARPYLDQRILGLLSLLAESFGKPHPEGTLIDVRLTHTMLASAIGANRTTVTRLLGDLNRTSEIAVILDAGEGRFCLRNWDGSAHLSGKD